MEKLAPKFKTLKEKLQTSDDFGEIMRCFFDLTEQKGFMQLGKRAKNPLVRKTLELVAEKVFQQKVPVTNMLLIHIKNQHFYHGSCFIQGTAANVIYFEDIDMGLAAVMKNFPTVDYVRFTCFRVEADEGAILNPGSRSIN